MKRRRLTFKPAPKRQKTELYPQSEYQRQKDAEIREASGGDFFTAELIRNGIVTINECRAMRNNY